jgi:superfamily II DNA or RNA helicase
MAYLIPYINIITCNNNMQSSINIGQLKDEINLECLELIMPLMNKNKDFVDYVIASNYNFIPLRDYYNNEVAEIFDIYGGEINKTINDNIYTIQIYFYKIKNSELLTKEVINKFQLIFRYDYFVRNNILDMKWHNYRFNKYFIENLNKKKFLDLNYVKPDYCNTELFAHQKNNLARMLNIHTNPTCIKISDNMPIYFENKLIYDMVKEEFISEHDIPTFHITSGMILDEPGTGKTLQFILYLLEITLKVINKALVLVPNNNIKLVWMTELKKHINPGIIIPFDIMTFDELEQMIIIDDNHLMQYNIIGIDEIHNLYNKPKGNLFNKIITSSIKYRWGITGTPFVSSDSFFQIIKFLTGNNKHAVLNNERISNNPLIQDQLIKLFLKNNKKDMIEYQWPELNINDVYVKLDIVQQNMYDAEKMLHHNNDRLRRLVCEINLMFSEGEFKTPNELKQYGVKHYKKLYEAEQSMLDTLTSQLENIIANSSKFKDKEYERRIIHFKELIHNQTEKTIKYKKVSDFIMSAIENINKVMNQSDDNNDNEDSKCPICWDNYNIPISYIKSCGHYFCKTCLDSMMKINSNFNCPKCRNKFDYSDIINVQQMSDINNSSKIHELLNIIKPGLNESKYIIFTQFDKVIDKIKMYLTCNNITSETLTNYDGEQILLLSSQQNAEGINLSMFDKMIIFEPFEDNVYCNQVEKQLIARIHRIGRSKPVDVYRFITEGTIEETIYKLTPN